jgi:hypothetical protein
METGWPSMAASAGNRFTVLLFGPDHLRQVLQVDLVADARTRRHHGKIVEGLLAPAQEGVAFAVALEFPLHVDAERIGPAEGIHHDRVVDNQIDRRKRVDLLRISAELRHSRPHGRQIDDCRHAGKILHQHTRRAIGDFAVRLALLQPGGKRRDVFARDAVAVFIAQQIFQQNLVGLGQTGDVAEAVLRRHLQIEIAVALAGCGQGLFALEAVEGLGHGVCSPFSSLSGFLLGQAPGPAKAKGVPKPMFATFLCKLSANFGFEKDTSKISFLVWLSVLKPLSGTGHVPLGLQNRKPH